MYHSLFLVQLSSCFINNVGFYFSVDQQGNKEQTKMQTKMIWQRHNKYFIPYETDINLTNHTKDLICNLFSQS